MDPSLDNILTRRFADQVHRKLVKIAEDVEALNGTRKARLDVTAKIRSVSEQLTHAITVADPIQQPQFVFDPGNPSTLGFFIALALTTQDRRPLDRLEEFYGGGIYALYYNGAFDLYQPLARSETPIYIGMAVQHGDSTKPGAPLFKRLMEHCKSIGRATDTLAVGDFDCRALVIQRGWESAAENYLIRLFRPIWNKETKLVFGFGKHGDKHTTRRNKRSPWDTLHIGRQWAGHDELEDQKSPARIRDEIEAHFKANPALETFEEVLVGFTKSLKQF